MAKRYCGWIFVEKAPGLRDHFSIHVTREGREPLVRAMGYGPSGAADAVAYFEEKLGLGSVRLEQTPIGLRVFVQEKGDGGR